jgi:CRP-like cAMP-binding protein
LLRLVRLLRVVKVLKIRPEIRRWLQYSRHANLLRLVRLVLSFLILNHYAACIWFGAVASDQTKARIVNHDPIHLYVVSFYTTLLVIQGQNLDELFTDGEYIFCISAMLFGAIVMAVVFGNVAILIANYYENQSSHQKKMEWLFSSMTRMKLPMDLQNRINDYYQAMWERHGTLDGAVTAFIPELSRNLAYEVELFLRMDMINRAPIFQSCSAKVVQELVMELELQVFMPGDYIVVRGEVGNDMYFVQNGVCEVTKDLQPPSTTASFQQVRRGTVDASANEIILKTLGQGDYFGEIALLMNCKRTANVRAHVFSELCALTRQVFENISMRYLEDRTIIEKFIMDKYDPGMLQAAMKQSHELAMRGHAPNVVRGSTPAGGSEADTGLELLRKIDERLVRLEQRIDRESNDRRDSEIRMAAVSSGPRFEATLTAQQIHSSPMRGDKADFVLFEPERMSQRHLQLSPLGLQRGSSKAAQIAEITESPHPVDGPIYDGEATDEHADQKRSVWKRPSMHRSGSWRNARREGSAGSLRLRGLAKPSAASNTRHSSRAASLTAAISAAEAVSVHHSSLKREPSLRNGSLNSSSGADRSTTHNERNREDEEDSKSERDRDREQGLLSADSLDALANTFAEMTEQRDSVAPQAFAH